MLRTVLRFRIRRPWSSRAPCCERTGRGRIWALLAFVALLVALAALLPRPARAAAPDGDPLDGVVAEALFLSDSLPPGGHELDLVVAGAPGAEGAIGVQPAMQLALRPSPRVGLTAQVAVDPSTGVETSGVHSPSGSLRFLLRPPRDGALGVATCFDVLGPGPGHGVEVGLGLGLIRAIGQFAFRAGASAATAVDGWDPRLSAGLSAAVAFGERWRLFGEAIVEAGGGATAFWAGPSAKLTLSPEVSLAAGALLDFRDPSLPPRFVIQLAQAL